MEQDDVARKPDFDALTQVITALKGLDEEARQRVFDSVATFFGLSGARSKQVMQPSAPTLSSSEQSFTTDRSLSPKQFMFEKQPKTDVHRVACLGYYLTHYRDIPHFKTIDISKLNTEAAQPKFSNAAKAVDNASMYGYLAQATKGNKQLSAAGERFVQEMPDLVAAKAALTSARVRRKGKRAINRLDAVEDGDPEA